jgi:protein O-GlcNAc transferase
VEGLRFDGLLRPSPPPPPPPPHDNAPLPDRRLRVGYVSADLGRHPVGYFLAPVLAAHDRAGFAIHCYSARTAEDDITARCKAASESWQIVAGLDDAALAERIRADGIDILVDLAGHTGDNRLRCFALKPAPVQVTWLGYPGTTGLREIDYRLTDAIVDPVGAADALSSEILVRLPNGFLCYTPPAGFDPAAPPASTAGGITFGSFNNLAKFDAEAAALWARILHRVPGSRLLLKSLQTADPPSWRRYLALFAAHGIAADRVVALPWLPSAADNLAAYGQLDIALDPFPYNGTTTSCDALWMGVPVVTLAGNRHAGRVGASIVRRLGMAELIAATPDDYVEIAVRLAADPGRLAALRGELRERFRASPLHDSRGLARDIEAAYRTMWQRWCAARP